jgi:hypothetical protein
VPNLVEFYDKSWVEVGTKRSLCDQLAEITSIDRLFLRGNSPANYAVAERVSWAALRHTTRIEDMAYSLMGILRYSCQCSTARASVHLFAYRMKYSSRRKTLQYFVGMLTIWSTSTTEVYLHTLPASSQPQNQIIYNPTTA